MTVLKVYPGIELAGGDVAAATVRVRVTVLCRMLRLLQDVHVRGESSRKRHRPDQHGVSDVTRR